MRTTELLLLVSCGVLALATSPSSALADTIPRPLPFSQNWTTTTLITTDNDWSGVPGIRGELWNLDSVSPGFDVRSFVREADRQVSVKANQSAVLSTASGLAEYDGLSNRVVALRGSSTADVVALVITLDTTRFQSISVAYNARDIDSISGHSSAQQIALQYRAGPTRSFSNVTGGTNAYIADATASGATKVTAVSATLPTDANRQKFVQVRILTGDASGTDEWVGIDDISITGTLVSPTPTPTATPNGATATPTPTTPACTSPALEQIPNGSFENGRDGWPVGSGDSDHLGTILCDVS